MSPRSTYSVDSPEDEDTLSEQVGIPKPKGLRQSLKYKCRSTTRGKAKTCHSAASTFYCAHYRNQMLRLLIIISRSFLRSLIGMHESSSNPFEITVRVSTLSKSHHVTMPAVFFDLWAASVRLRSLCNPEEDKVMHDSSSNLFQNHSSCLNTIKKPSRYNASC